jgi:tetratricopeptide (TPR) repeat protein
MRVAKSFIRIVLPGLFLLACTVGAVGEDAAKKKERAHSHLIEARRLAADYKIDKAADKARDALKDDPNLPEAHVYIGLERFRANDLKEAEAEFKRALDLDPYQAAAHCYLGYVLYQQGQFDAAADQWNLSTRLDSTSPQAFAGLALSQFKLGQEEQALKTYEKALMYDRRFADPQFLESDKGPKWSGQLLQDVRQLLAKVSKPSYP